MIRYKPSAKPLRKAQRGKIWQKLMFTFTAAALCTLWASAGAWHRVQLAQLAADAVPGAVNDVLVQAIVQKCVLKQPTIVTLRHAARQPVVQYLSAKQLARHIRDAGCPLFHIPLADSDRSIGLCTDAALYVQLLDAWIVPDTNLGLEQAQRCADSSAVLFLEPFYEPWTAWLLKSIKTVAVYAPNFEHVFGYDQDAHKRMQLILCKVYRCNELMDAYIEDIGSEAILVYTGHTSLDPLVFAPKSKQAILPRKQLKPAHQHSFITHQTLPATIAAITRIKSRDQQQAGAPSTSAQPPTASTPQQQGLAPGSEQQPAQHGDGPSTATQQYLAAGVEPVAALHVRGKSSLKHTKQLLDCWLKHPEWPQLTVLGPMPNEQITLQETKKYLAAGNIKAPRPGKVTGPGWPSLDPVSTAELSTLLLSHPLHIMPSEREGFGHTINEGRAAGALLIVPDHPPMNEVVFSTSGLLIEPTSRFSHTDDPVPVLGKYANISASISPEGICEAVTRALSISSQQRLAMGMKARQLFESDRTDFEQRMRQVKILVQNMIQTAALSKVAGTGAATSDVAEV